MIVKYPLWLRVCHTAALCVLLYSFVNLMIDTTDRAMAVLLLAANIEFFICNVCRIRFRGAVLASMREADADKVRFI